MSELIDAGTVVCVGGPPHSGKSVFLTALNSVLVRCYSNQVFLERVVPDGEGNWSGQTAPDVRDSIRKKGKFSDSFVEQKLRDVEGLSRTKRLVLIDLGGKLAPDIDRFLHVSTHAILLSSTDGGLSAWGDVVHKSGCNLLASLSSRHQFLSNGTFDASVRSEVDFNAKPWAGVLWNLDRDNADVTYVDAISSIAQHLGVMFLSG